MEVGILGGNRKLIRASSVLTVVLSLILLFMQPSMQVATVIGLILSGANFWLSFRNKI